MVLTGLMRLAASPSWREQKVCNGKSLGVTGNVSEGGEVGSNQFGMYLFNLVESI